MSGYKKYQARFRIAFYVPVAVEQLVSSDIRYEQLLVVEHFDKARLAAFRRSITIAIGIAGRQNTKRRLPYEFLYPCGHRGLHFSLAALGRVAEFILIFSLHVVA